MPASSQEALRAEEALISEEEGVLAILQKTYPPGKGLELFASELVSFYPANPEIVKRAMLEGESRLSEDKRQTLHEVLMYLEEQAQLRQNINLNNQLFLI